MPPAWATLGWIVRLTPRQTPPLAVPMVRRKLPVEMAEAALAARAGAPAAQPGMKHVPATAMTPAMRALHARHTSA